MTLKKKEPLKCIKFYMLNKNMTLLGAERETNMHEKRLKSKGKNEIVQEKRLVLNLNKIVEK